MEASHTNRGSYYVLYQPLTAAEVATTVCAD